MTLYPIVIFINIIYIIFNKVYILFVLRLVASSSKQPESLIRPDIWIPRGRNHRMSSLLLAAIVGIPLAWYLGLTAVGYYDAGRVGPG